MVPLVTCEIPIYDSEVYLWTNRFYFNTELSQLMMLTLIVVIYIWFSDVTISIPVYLIIYMPGIQGRIKDWRFLGGSGCAFIKFLPLHRQIKLHFDLFSGCVMIGFNFPNGIFFNHEPLIKCSLKILKVKYKIRIFSKLWLDPHPVFQSLDQVSGHIFSGSSKLMLDDVKKSSDKELLTMRQFCVLHWE